MFPVTEPTAPVTDPTAPVTAPTDVLTLAISAETLAPAGAPSLLNASPVWFTLADVHTLDTTFQAACHAAASLPVAPSVRTVVMMPMRNALTRPVESMTRLAKFVGNVTPAIEPTEPVTEPTEPVTLVAAPTFEPTRATPFDAPGAAFGSRSIPYGVG